MTESHNSIQMQQQPSTPRGQYYGMLNEPLPPTPQFKGQQQTNMFSNQPIASTSTTTPFFAGPETRGDSNIVGPSDHYGSTTINQHTNLEHVYAKNIKSSSQEGTKVCVIIDSKTPIIIKIPIPSSRITLADLKSALPAINQPNYKYFFKSNDSEFGIVKEEIMDDNSRLPIYKNRVVAWIVTPAKLNDDLASMTNKTMTTTARSETDTCNLTYSNTSYTYDYGSSSLMTSTDVDSTSYFTETDDDDSISCSNYSETTCDTFISQRKSSPHYNGNSNGLSKSRSPNNYHHHRQSNNRSPYRYSSSQQYARNLHDNISQSSASSSSTASSSASQSDATAVHCVTVHLVLTDENFLGLHVCPTKNAITGHNEGIFIHEISENSALAMDGRIESGDKLIQVNEVNLEELSNNEAVKVIKNAVIKRGPIKLVVAKYIESNRNEPFDGVMNGRDTIHPIDTAAWVAHTQAITIPNNQIDRANSATSSPSFGSNAQDTDCIRPASASVPRLNSVLRLSKGTTDIKEMIHHMKSPEVGLEIKDREWLKIQIPRAFLGTDLITWLERNVYGFINNREAKKFASRMLKDGYIRDPISKKSFSSKSYYTFTQ